MKGIKLFFVGCLGLLVFQATIAADNDDTVRAAVRRDAITARQKSPMTSQSNKQALRGGGRVTTSTTSAVRERGAVKNPGRTATTNTSPRTATVRTVSERNQTNNSVVTRSPKNVAQTTTARTAARTATVGTRTATTRGATKSGVRKSRAGTTIGITGAISANYSNCRKVYYDCMDEFCANKDSQLRRCSCSSRAHEFDGAKKQLSRIEEKMLDFNQRLLTVNLDAEDVDAMVNSTAGEDAYYDTTDKTKSKQMLDDISKKLNETFGEDATTGMGAISLSLNADSAFDSVNSLNGLDTTLKNGTELYRAALPVCREMVLETCSTEELSLAESGYQMQIEQDCNTVSKSYQSQTEQARAKVLESSALLDMSRLDAHKKRNSDDILTCKKKMLDMLTNSTVCGEKMTKCLDITGQYVDPTTGKAFLTENLSNLATLITRPNAGESWTKITANKTFVDFLEDKKEYLKTAMENCQDIAETVWDEFLPDALAQIKLAQDAKLEEVRQACTTLVSECLISANESITNFDARALSVFGVSADLTANTMCNDVRNACTKLLSTETTDSNATESSEWGSGMSDIATEKTFETILSSCTQVGRNCFIQTCKSISGNFGLCNDILRSPNRHSILTRSACWNDVKQCVADASNEVIHNIMVLKDKNHEELANNNFYKEVYGWSPYDQNNTNGSLQSLCDDDCSEENGFDIEKCGICRLTERIWGNCEHRPSYNGDNRIREPIAGVETLMYWFAQNTGTNDARNSCTNVRCARGGVYYPDTDGGLTTQCADDIDEGDITADHRYCPISPQYNTVNSQPTITDFGTENWLYTPDNINYSYVGDEYPHTYFFRMFENNSNNSKCCWSRPTKNGGSSASGGDDSGIYIDPVAPNTEMYLGQNTCCGNTPKEYWFNNTLRSICLPNDIDNYYRLGARDNNKFIICVPSNAGTPAGNSFNCEGGTSGCSNGYNSALSAEENYPHGKNVFCDGTFVVIDKTNQNQPQQYDLFYSDSNNSASNSSGPGVKTKYCPSDTKDYTLTSTQQRNPSAGMIIYKEGFNSYNECIEWRNNGSQ